MITPEDKAAAEAYCSERTPMTDQIIATELPLHIAIGAGVVLESEMRQAFIDAQRQAIRRFVDAVKKESDMHACGDVEYSMNSILQRLDDTKV